MKTNRLSLVTKSLLVTSFAVTFAFSSQLYAASGQLLKRIPFQKSLVASAFKINKREDVTKIVVKFKEGTGVRLNQNSLSTVTEDSSLPAVPGLTKNSLVNELGSVRSRIQSMNLPLNRLFSKTETQLNQLKALGEQRSGKELPDLNLYFEIPVPSYLSQAQIDQMVTFFNNLSSVEIAYPKTKTEVASLTPDYQDEDASDPAKAFQGYLESAAEGGIDAKYAWTFAGGKGSGVKVVDIEGGWTLDHEDFPTMFHAQGTMSTSALWVDHGTAVMGVMAATDNGYGVTGIANEAQYGYSSINGQSSSAAIADAAAAVGPGGIILVELHRAGPALQETCSCNDSQCNYIAIEYWPDDFDAIQTATANGVIVVEAAGNGSANLDDPIYEGKFDRTVRDSGAILVGGSYSASRAPKCWSNYGDRVDMHGWGENVVTTGYGSLYSNPSDPEDNTFWYTSTFNGTSSASPVVVGAIASLQGVAQSNLSQTLTPAEVRDLLVSTGTAQTGELTKPIGPLPNLKAAIDELLGNQEEPEQCTEYTGYVYAHVMNGRAYGMLEGFLYNYYATGSGELIGNSNILNVTLRETEEGYFEIGECAGASDGDEDGASDGDEDSIPVIDSHSESVDSSTGTITVTGSASDADGDLSSVRMKSASGDNILCTGTTSFSCTTTKAAGTYSFYLVAYDAAGNTSVASDTFSVTVEEQSAGTCVTAANSTHINEGRAHQCTIWYSVHACANGSGTDLGYSTLWYDQTSSIEEQSPGHWVKVLSCP